MRSAWQLPYQLQDGGRVYSLDNVAVNVRLFCGVGHEVGKMTSLPDVIERFIDDDPFQPAVKIPFRRIIALDAPEHFYKGMAQDIPRLMLINGIAHGNSHGKAIKPPVQLLLRLSIAVAAIMDDVSKLLFQSPFFVAYSSCKNGRGNAPDIQLVRIIQVVIEPDIHVYHIHDGDHPVIGAQFIA